MILYSHRGNLNGKNPELENTPEYIDKAISNGFSVEVDIWKVGKKFFLGHDNPDTEIPYEWLEDRRNDLLVHAKNFNAFSLFTFQHLNRDKELAVFFHENEKYALVHNCRNSHGIIIDGIIWAHCLDEINCKTIIPLLSSEDLSNNFPQKQIWGVCSDHIADVKS
tara:strand:- start:110 stop:604 length:495 start_codon:yes stop_codon:yes gene_type:complete